MMISDGPRLGQLRHADTDGRVRSDDNDCVTFDDIPAVDVKVTRGLAFLSGWIDIDGEGNWFGAGDRVFDDVPLEHGPGTRNDDTVAHFWGAPVVADLLRSIEWMGDNPQSSAMIQIACSSSFSISHATLLFVIVCIRRS